MLSLQNFTVSLVNKLDKPIIKNVSLEIKTGQISVLMGPNGSGKSTLAYALMGHPAYVINAGSIVFNGESLTELPIEKKARIGIFLACQYAQEIPGVQVFTFLKEAHRMLTGKDISVEEFKALLYAAFDIVKLDHSFAYRNLFEGFSGGEKKKLEIVQLLLFKPKVAILDEIDSGLDVDALRIIANAIVYAKSNNPKMSILLITHYNRILSYITPDVVHILSNGTIIKSGDVTLSNYINQSGYDGLQL